MVLDNISLATLGCRRPFPLFSMGFLQGLGFLRDVLTSGNCAHRRHRVTAAHRARAVRR